MSIGKLNFRTTHQVGDQISFDSVGINLISEYLSEDHEIKPGILDFAPADNNVFQHFAESNCIYYSSQKLIESFLMSAEDGVDSNIDQHFADLFPSQWIQHEDVSSCNPIAAILVWDLFNYLSRTKIIKVMTIISRLCRKGARLYALVWLTDRIPNLPGNFRVAADGKIEYQFNSSELSIAPKLAAQTIVSMMPSFIPHRMYASDTGILEVILEFDKFVEPPELNVIPSSQLTGMFR